MSAPVRPWPPSNWARTWATSSWAACGRGSTSSAFLCQDTSTIWTRTILTDPYAPSRSESQQSNNVSVVSLNVIYLLFWITGWCNVVAQVLKRLWISRPQEFSCCLAALALVLMSLQWNVHGEYGNGSFHPPGSQQIHPVSDGSQVWRPISHLLRKSRWAHQYPFVVSVSQVNMEPTEAGADNLKTMLKRSSKSSKMNLRVTVDASLYTYSRLGWIMTVWLTPIRR